MGILQHLRVVEDRRHEKLQQSLRALEERVAGAERRLDALEHPVAGQEDECDVDGDVGYDEINGLFRRVHQLEIDIGYAHKLTDYAVDMSESTQASFEQGAVRNGDRINRVADWVRSEFQRRLRLASLPSVRHRFPKGYQKNRKTLKGSKQDQEVCCPLVTADPTIVSESECLRA